MTDPAFSPAVSGRRQPARLHKALRARDLYFAALTGVIGSGWLFGSYKTAAVAGPAGILSWIIGGFFICIIALTWAEVSSSVPLAGGVARYPAYSHGGLAAAMVGWASILPAIATPATETIGVTSVIQTLVTYFSPRNAFLLISSDGMPTAYGFLIALALAVFFFYINYLGVRRVARVNTIASLLKLVIIPAAFILILISGILAGLGGNFSAPAFAPFGYGPVFTALPATGVIFAYLGFRQPIDMAAEARNPGRDLWRAILAMVGTALVFYTMLQIAFDAGLKWNDPAQGTAGVHAGAWSRLGTQIPMASLPLFYESLGLGLAVIAALLFVGGLVGPSADTNQYYASTARVLFGMAREGYLSRKFLTVHPRYRVPVWGLVTTLVVTVILLVMGFGGALNSSVGGAWSALTSIITTTLVFAYMAAPLALPIFRRSYPDLERSFAVPMHRVVSVIAFIVASLMVYWGAGSLFAPTDPYGGYILIAVMLGGSLFYINAREKNRRDLWSGAWMIGYLIFTAVLLALGEYQGKLIPLPWDWIADIAGAIGFYIWALRTALPAEAVRMKITAAIAQQEGE